MKTIALENMTIGMTTVLWGKVVTRWSETVFEVGTWGRNELTIDQAVEALMN